MTIKENISLLPYNTFGIDVKARLFIEYYSLGARTSFSRRTLTESSSIQAWRGRSSSMTTP